MIYIQLHRFVNDCVKIDIILVLTKKQPRNIISIITEYFNFQTQLKILLKYYQDTMEKIPLTQR